MQITCPNCTTAYDVQPGTLGEKGRSVRCLRCRTVWLATLAAARVPVPVAVAEPVRRIADAGPAGEPALADQGKASGEFEWSIDSPGIDGDTQDGQGERANAAQDAADAEFLALPDEIAAADAPSLVPAAEPHTLIHAAPQPENIEEVAARREQEAQRRRWWKLPWLKLPKWKLFKWKLFKRKASKGELPEEEPPKGALSKGKPPKGKPRLPRPGARTLAAVLVASLAALVIWRTEVVRAAPQTASLFEAVGLSVNLRGLVFANMRTTGEMHEGVSVLIIEGAVLNVTDRTIEVPRLRFAVRNRAGHEVYAWTSVTGRSILAPGETAAFRTRLASPPPDARDVIVRFFTRRDFLAGMH